MTIIKILKSKMRREDKVDSLMVVVEVDNKDIGTFYADGLEITNEVMNDLLLNSGSDTE